MGMKRLICVWLIFIMLAGIIGCGIESGAPTHDNGGASGEAAYEAEAGEHTESSTDEAGAVEYAESPTDEEEAGEYAESPPDEAKAGEWAEGPTDEGKAGEHAESPTDEGKSGEHAESLTDEGKAVESPGSSGDGAGTEESSVTIDENGSYDSADEVALYLVTYHHLPGNYITKGEARKLGWSGGSVEEYAPGKCIGGDTFGNREGQLPKNKKYHECDIGTLGEERRGPKRLIYSEDFEVYYTEDHYESFTRLY